MLTELGKRIDERGENFNKELKKYKERPNLGNFLVVQWLRLHASTAGGPDSIPGQGTKIPQATWHGQKNDPIRNEEFNTEIKLTLEGMKQTK